MNASLSIIENQDCHQSQIYSQTATNQYKESSALEVLDYSDIHESFQKEEFPKVEENDKQNLSDTSQHGEVKDRYKESSALEELDYSDIHESFQKEEFPKVEENNKQNLSNTSQHNEVKDRYKESSALEELDYSDIHESFQKEEFPKVEENNKQNLSNTSQHNEVKDRYKESSALEELDYSDIHESFQKEEFPKVEENNKQNLSNTSQHSKEKVDDEDDDDDSSVQFLGRLFSNSDTIHEQLKECYHRSRADHSTFTESNLSLEKATKNMFNESKNADSVVNLNDTKEPADDTKSKKELFYETINPTQKQTIKEIIKDTYDDNNQRIAYTKDTHVWMKINENGIETAKCFNHLTLTKSPTELGFFKEKPLVLNAEDILALRHMLMNASGKELISIKKCLKRMEPSLRNLHFNKMSVRLDQMKASTLRMLMRINTQFSSERMRF